MFLACQASMHWQIETAYISSENNRIILSDEEKVKKTKLELFLEIKVKE